MNRETETHQQEDEATVSRLINLAGPRAEIPAELQSRVHANVRREWRNATQARSHLRWAIPAALAATVLIAAILRVPAPENPSYPIGQIAQVARNPSPATQYSLGDNVFAGDVVRTGSDKGLGIALKDDISVRIAANSALRLDTADALTLLSGMVYVDTGERIYRDRHISVQTSSGTVTDVGTQFSVADAAGRMSVAVREGRVDIEVEQNSHSASAGTRLTFAAGDVIREEVSPYDASWQWASALAPEFDIDQHSLLDFLEWASRETGKRLVFSNDQLREAAGDTKLFGSVRNLTPAEAIESVLTTTRFRYRIDAESIIIE